MEREEMEESDGRGPRAQTLRRALQTLPCVYKWKRSNVLLGRCHMRLKYHTYVQSRTRRKGFWFPYRFSNKLLAESTATAVVAAFRDAKGLLCLTRNAGDVVRFQSRSLEKACTGAERIFLGVAATNRQHHTFQVEREAQLLV